MDALQIRESVGYVLTRPRGNRSSRQVRRRRWLVMLVLLLFYLPAAGISILSLINGTHWWGIAASPTGNIWLVTWSDRGLSTDYNIHVGDQILTVDGHPPQSEDEINQAGSIELLSPGNSTPHNVIWRAPNQLENLLSISWIVSGPISLLLGLLVFLHATDRVLAPRFFLLWSALGIANTLIPATSFGNLLAVHISNVLYVGFATGLLASFLWLLLFPSRSGSLATRYASSQGQTTAGAGYSSNYRWFPQLLVATGILIATLFLVSVALKQPDLLNYSVLFASVQTLLALCLSLFLILRASLPRRATVTRERARTLLGGMLIGLLPPLLLTILPELISGQPLVQGQVSDLAIIALPLAFGYAIVRRDLLRLDSFIRKSVMGLLSVLGLAIVAVLLAQALGQLPVVPAAVLGILAGALLLPVILRLAQWLTEAWLFPQVRAYRRILQAEDHVGAKQGDLSHLAGRLVAEVCLALPVQARVFVPDKETNQLVAVQRQSEPVLGMSDSHLAIALSVTEHLSQEHAVWVEPDPQWSPLGGAEASWEAGKVPLTTSAVPDQATNLLAPATWRLLVPIRVETRLVGVLALSVRDDEQEFSDTDTHLLQKLVARRALALDYALLYADLHAAYEREQHLNRLSHQFLQHAHQGLQAPLLDMKQLMAAVATLQLERTHPGEQSSWFRRLAWLVDALERNIHRLLQSAETQMQLGSLQTTTVAVRRVAEEVSLALAEQARAKQVQLRNTLPLDMLALADEGALHETLFILLDCAVRRSPPHNGVWIQGHASVDSEGTQVAHVILREWGPALAQPQCSLLFERFFPGRPPETTRLPGCKELVQALGGRIWVESSSQRHTAWHVTFPMPHAPAGGGYWQQTGEVESLAAAGRRVRSFARHSSAGSSSS